MSNLIDKLTRYSIDKKARITIAPDTDSENDLRVSLVWFCMAVEFFCFDRSFAEVCKHDTLSFDHNLMIRTAESKIKEGHKVFFVRRIANTLSLDKDRNNKENLAAMLVIKETEWIQLLYFSSFSDDFVQKVLESMLDEIRCALMDDAYEYIFEDEEFDDYHSEGGFATPEEALRQAQKDFPQCAFELKDLPDFSCKTY